MRDGCRGMGKSDRSFRLIGIVVFSLDLEDWRKW